MSVKRLPERLFRPRISAVPPLEPGWVIADGRPVFHRHASVAGAAAPVAVHVHGFGISGTYLEPTAAALAHRFTTFVPDLPGMGRSRRPEHTLGLAGLADALVAYLDAVAVERATLVGNSLGCPVICEVATRYPDRIERAVLVSPAGGPNNQPLARALRQMAMDSVREPLGMVPIASRDYLRFGVWQSWQLFRSMVAFPTMERLHHLEGPTLVVAGRRDPLVDTRRASLLAVVPHVTAVAVPGAHALNFSSPELLAALVEAWLDGGPLSSPSGPLAGVEEIVIPTA
jgi:pimeloyl-ACP methyl ester carboxylesterase